jgi:hypothetical protein
MSTSALIGTVALDNRSYEASMVGYDGYPMGVGKKLAALVVQHGLVEVLDQVLCYSEWRCILDGEFIVHSHEVKVEGYGIADRNSRQVPWSDNGGLHTGSTDNIHRTPAEWAYLFNGLSGENEALYVYHHSALVARVATPVLGLLTDEHWEQITNKR